MGFKCTLSLAGGKDCGLLCRCKCVFIAARAKIAEKVAQSGPPRVSMMALSVWGFGVLEAWLARVEQSPAIAGVLEGFPRRRDSTVDECSPTSQEVCVIKCVCWLQV